MEAHNGSSAWRCTDKKEFARREQKNCLQLKYFLKNRTGFLGMSRNVERHGPKPCPGKGGGLEGEKRRASDSELVFPLQDWGSRAIP